MLVCEIIFAFNATFFSLVVCQFEANSLLHKPNGRNGRFRPAKTFEEKEKCVASAIPKCTGNIKTNGRLEFWNNVCGIRRLVEEKNANLDFILLDASDIRCSSVAVVVISCSYIIEKDTAFCFGDFNNCNVTFNVNSK